MELRAGVRLGPYEVTAPLGRGGMGEVYRARDLRLGRDVALKILPDVFAQDVDRLARFEREARVLASLSHPNIAVIHGVEETGPIKALVLELVEGPTLADRIADGRIPVREAVSIARQIADAISAAHAQGVIHRDLKPSNIKLRPDGTVKVLDFGLAKSLEPAEERSARISGSPTVTSPAVTARGVILGTAAYMSPEQVLGAAADRQSDIWAFGCVLYEVLTGRRVFEGEASSEIFRVILHHEPDVSILPPDTPEPVRRLLRRCLAKEPKARLSHIDVARLEIDDALAPTAGATPTARPSSAGPRWRPLGVAAVVFLAGLAAGFWASHAGGPARPASSPAAVRFSLFPPEGTEFHAGIDGRFALSPGGRQLAFVADTSDGSSRLWVRAFNAETARPLPQTEGARAPFWNAGGDWIGFFAGDSLMKVRASGDTPQVITRGLSPGVAGVGGAAWNADDVIIFSSSVTSGLSRVSARGGPILPATTLDRSKGEISHLWPAFLGDGRRFVYNRVGATTVLSVASLDDPAERSVAEFPSGFRSALGRAPGYLLYAQDAAVFARPFNEQSLKFTGDAIRVADNIPSRGPGNAPFAVSASGTLVYWANSSGQTSRLLWIDRQGRRTTAVDAPGAYSGFGLSPDGRRLAFARVDASQPSSIWVRNLDRGTETRLTFAGTAFGPQWMPDGARVAFSLADSGEPPNLFVQPLSASGGGRRLATAPIPQFLSDVRSDGGLLVYGALDPKTQGDLWTLRLGDLTAQRLPFNTPYYESHGKLSPDDAWIAYVSNETGRNEVWLARFPSGDLRQRISVDGGDYPQWRRDGTELFYLSPGHELVAVTVTPSDPSPTIGAPETLFAVRDIVELGTFEAPAYDLYEVAPGGDRFLIPVRTGEANPPIQVVLNWPSLLDPDGGAAPAR